MRYLSICSGIEAATAAWHSLGWCPVAFAEIDHFPSAVLAHHYPDVPNLGDFTRIAADAIGPVDLLVGGTPCQSFSIAGLRNGLDDDRGNLAIEFCRLARRARPRWVVWENVPGVLSLDGGRAFASILGGLADSGYGLAYRVLDAQFVRVDGFGRAVPQRRRRVFVVGCLGDWRRAAAVLFERSSLSWDSPPRSQAGEGVARPFAGCPEGGSGYRNDSDIAENLVAQSLTASDGGISGKDGIDGRIVALNDVGGAAHALTATATATATGHLDPTTQDFLGVAGTGLLVAHALRADGFDASEDGTGRGTPLVPVALPILEPTKRTGVSSTDTRAGDGIGGPGDPMFTLQAAAQHGVAVCFDETQITSKENRCQPREGDPCHPLAAGARPPTIAFHARQDPDHGPVTHPLDTDGSSIGVFTGWLVRRLTPTECERLQGFPDGFTAIPYRGKPAADGPRYKALGNSMAVNVMRWIGRRIEMVEAIGVQEAS